MSNTKVSTVRLLRTIIVDTEFHDSPSSRNRTKMRPEKKNTRAKYRLRSSSLFILMWLCVENNILFSSITNTLLSPSLPAAGQLSQSAHFSLQLPYTVLGLGRSANFLDHLFVGIPRQPGETVRKWRGLYYLDTAQHSCRKSHRLCCLTGGLREVHWGVSVSSDKEEEGVLHNQRFKKK